MKIEITEGTAKAIAKVHSETAIPDFAIIEMAVQFYKFQEHLSELTSRNISEYLRSNVLRLTGAAGQSHKLSNL